MYEQTDMAFARAYWHWFFLIQKAPIPETMIGANPAFYLRHKMGDGAAGMQPFDPRAWAEYERCFTPEAIHASCEDYRAAATIDLEHDRADREAGRKIACPLLALWGANGVVERCFRPLEDWGRVAQRRSRPGTSRGPLSARGGPRPRRRRNSNPSSEAST